METRSNSVVRKAAANEYPNSPQAIGSGASVVAGAPKLPDGDLGALIEQIEPALQDCEGVNLVREMFVLAATKTGDEFLLSLCEMLTRLLGARTAFVTQLLRPADSHVSVLGAWKDGARKESWVYELAGNPCALVYEGEPVLIPCDVAKNFEKKRDSGYESFVGVPLTDTDGAVVGHISVFGDTQLLDDRRLLLIVQLLSHRAQAELRRVIAEQKAAALLEQVTSTNQELAAYLRSATDWVWRSDRGGNVSKVTDAKERLNGLGQDAASAAVQRALSLTDEGQFETSASIVRDVEVEVESAEGGLYQLALNVVPLFDDGDEPSGYYGTARDVSKLRAAQREAARLEAEMHDFIESANAPIFGIAEDGGIVLWNRRMATLLGSDFAVGGEARPIRPWIAPPSWDALRRNLKAVMTGQGVQPQEITFLTAAGAELEIAVSWTAQRNRVGDIIGAIAVGQDVSAIRRAEAKVLQASKLATLGEMSTSIAHELNQPLNTISIAAGHALRLMQRENAKPERVVSKLERIADATQRAASIIEHMRIFSRRADESPAPVSVSECFENARVLIGAQLRDDGIEIVGQTDEEGKLVRAHPVRLEQVFLNVLSNARDALLGAELSRPVIRAHFDLSADERAICVTIDDNGPGISDVALERVFEPFYTTKPPGQGTGLGMAISYGIVKDLGGELTLRRLDNGTRVQIVLPVASVSPDSGEAVADAATAEGRTA